MAEPRTWELSAGSSVVGYLRWLDDTELYAEAPWPLASQVEAWFRQQPQVVAASAGEAEAAVPDLGSALATRFATRDLRDRLGLRAKEVTTVPREAEWLLALDPDRLPGLGYLTEEWAGNRFPPDLDVEGLIRETTRGEIRWGRGPRGSFKAGGRCADTSELWLTLHASGPVHTLAARWQGSLRGRPIRQHAGWLMRTPLQRLRNWLEANP